MDYQSRLEKISEAVFIKPSLGERDSQFYTNAVEFTSTINTIINGERRSEEKKQSSLFPDFLKGINEKIRKYGEPRTQRIEDLIDEISHRTYFAAKGYIILKDEFGNGRFTAYPHNMDPKRAVAVLFCLDSLLESFVKKDYDSYNAVRGVIDATASYLKIRSEKNPSQDLRGTKLDINIKKSGIAVLEEYEKLKRRAINNRDNDNGNFEKYVMMVALISTYEGLVCDIGKVHAEKSFGVLEEKKQIDTKEKINGTPKYWHGNYYKMMWKIGSGKMWQIIRPKSPKKLAPKTDDKQLTLN